MGRRRFVRLAVAAMLSTACVGNGGAGPSAVQGSTGTNPSSPSDAATLVRDCASSVYGDLGPSWRTDQRHVGPVWILPSYLRLSPRAIGATADGRVRPQKVLLVIERPGPVIVSVARASRPVASLLYDPALWNRRHRVPEGELRVRFEPCPAGPPTQFNGALLIAEPTCVRLVVTAPGGKWRGAVPFGERRCG